MVLLIVLFNHFTRAFSGEGHIKVESFSFSQEVSVSNVIQFPSDREVFVKLFSFFFSPVVVEPAWEEGAWEGGREVELSLISLLLCNQTVLYESITILAVQKPRRGKTQSASVQR